MHRTACENRALVQANEHDCDSISRSQADDARQAAGLARKRQKAEEPEAEPSYRRWSTSKWNELETKAQTRREQEIDRTCHDHDERQIDSLAYSCTQSPQPRHRAAYSSALSLTHYSHSADSSMYNLQVTAVRLRACTVGLGATQRRSQHQRLFIIAIRILMLHVYYPVTGVSSVQEYCSNTVCDCVPCVY